jgi:hypothetical protein
MNFAASIFPTSAVTTVVSGITNAIADNIVAVIGVLAFMVGLRMVIRLFNGSFPASATDRAEYARNHRRGI